MIEVFGLTKRYPDRTAVDDVEFRLDEGEIVGFLGPNGAGKSTTLRMVTGFIEPTAGAIRVDGIDALRDPVEARRRIGYMPEGVPLYPEMRAVEYLSHRAELKGLGRRARKDAVDRCLAQAGVEDAAGRILGQLSKGYRQRIGLAEALLTDPPILILDEPTAGLDPNQIRQVRSLVRGFAGKKTVFVSTHILPEVEATCQRVVVIHRGRIVEQGPPSGLRATAEAAQTIALVARGDETRLRAALETAEGVRSLLEVTPLAADEVRRFRVQADPGPEVAEAVFRAVAEAEGALRELKTESASLEDVFAELTTEDRGGAATEAEPERSSAATDAAQTGPEAAAGAAAEAEGSVDGGDEDEKRGDVPPSDGRSS